MVSRPIEVQGLAVASTDVLVQVQWPDDQPVSTVLRADQPSWTVPKPDESQRLVPWAYLPIGIEHILLGPDHLLFVLGLLLVVGRRWRLLVGTITAFTLGHSITLALAVLGVIQVRTEAIEAIIALSIVCLAWELARSATPENSWTMRYPWAVSAGFGLLHGLGFAGALTAVGLPQTDVPAVLLLFNIGVEVGQLLFVAVMLVLIAVLGRFKRVWPSTLRRVPVFVIGAIASYWVIERTVRIFVDS